MKPQHIPTVKRLACKDQDASRLKYRTSASLMQLARERTGQHARLLCLDGATAAQLASRLTADRARAFVIHLINSTTSIKTRYEPQ